jgi:hypothetical protein
MGKQLGIIQFTGKLGNTVGARKGGVQKSNTIRAHAGEVANPNTRAQMYQRAIMATVLQAYKQGKEIFDHSFEGAKGLAGNYAEFMKKNLPMLRAIVADDIAANPTQPGLQNAELITRGLRYTVPNPYIIADGSLTQDLFDVETSAVDGDGIPYIPLNPGDGVSRTTKVRDWYTNVGLVEGEIFTFVAFSAFNPAGIGFQVNNVPKNVIFNWIRFIVKPISEIDAALTFATAKWSDIFSITYSGAQAEVPFRPYSLVMFNDGTNYVLGMFTSQLINLNASCGCLGCIRSNVASGKRSFAQMKMVLDGGWAAAPQEYGLKPYYVPMEWRYAGSAIPGASDKILEGGDE